MCSGTPSNLYKTSAYGHISPEESVRILKIMTCVLVTITWIEYKILLLVLIADYHNTVGMA